MEILVSIRNKTNSVLYNKIVKPVCFMYDAEQVHNFFTKTGKFLGDHALTKKTISTLFNYQNKKLELNILGIKFRNPVGLSAGFDKNAELISIMEDVGFGFVEVGSITALPCEGNSGKRVDRIIDKKSLWVNFGLNNNGVKEITNRLEKERFNIPYGISVAKTNSKETVDPEIGINDYVSSLKESKNVGDYYTLNISCPNSYGGQPFVDPQLYESLLREVHELKIKKPVFVKLSPDLTKKHIDKLLQISMKHKINGFICTNLTKKHNLGKGGLSGKIVQKKSNELIKYIYKKTKGKYIIIGVGGIFSAEDAYKKIKAGASLVQLITGMIYEGPGLISNINYNLVKLLERDRYNNISEAIGVSNY
ncbi:quinone-dependent dihydroorotate dehydrogenase [Candidatus Pacearchaeota archaeon]|nr:quinone-dependent dihydroorotate dehydrogenase [Candidatus Pacearchaeota archaeon]